MNKDNKDNKDNEILEKCNKQLHTISRINYWKDKFNVLRGTETDTKQFKILFNIDYDDLYFDEILEKSFLLQYELESKRLII